MAQHNHPEPRPGMSPPPSSEPVEEASSLLRRIEAVLDREVRPALRSDGGDLTVVGIDADNIVQVRLLGSCQGCTSSIITLTMLAEQAVKAEVPEVRFLEAVP